MSPGTLSNNERVSVKYFTSFSSMLSTETRLLPANREDSLFSRSLPEAGGSALSSTLFGSDLGTEVAGVVVGA